MAKINACGLVLEYKVMNTTVKVYLPFAVQATAELRSSLQEQLSHKGIFSPVVFFNALPIDSSQELLELEDDEEPWVVISSQEQDKERARLIINAWLTENNVTPMFSNSAQIEIINGTSSWRQIGLSQELASTPISRIDITEGYTTHQKKNAISQSSQVYINGNYHTLGAIVHELFHTLAHPELGNIWDGTGINLEEALTEFLTCWAIRLFLRTDIKGGLIYAKGIRILRNGISNNLFSEQDIINLFFFRDEKALKKIRDYYYEEENKK